MFAAAVGAGEQRILSVQRDVPNAALHYVGIHLDAAVVEESRKPILARQRMRIASASLVGINPHAHLADVISKIVNGHPNSRINELPALGVTRAHR
jgi:transposase IS66-like protein